ncbi:major facilitator superfamily transporter [Xylariales sp. AK1849]|nr:major facilitator superfamily transporter [Xylariales sp. AK1849]
MADNRQPVAAEELDQQDAYERPARARPVQPKAAIGALLALLLLVNLSTSLYQLPLNRVIERRLCREYYAEHDPSQIGHDGSIVEDQCKVDEIQKGLAWILGAMETAWIVGDFVMTIPLGFMTEKYGQRTILWLNIVPRVFMLSWAVIVGYFEQSIPTKAIIAGPILSVLGGDCVFNSIAYALAAGITDDYVLRATYFGWMSSVSYVVALLGPALASATMTILLWLPFWIGIILLVLAIPTISLLPDCLGSGDLDRSLPQHGDELSRPLLSSPVLKAHQSGPSILRSIFTRFETLRSILASHPRNLVLLFVSFFLTSLASSDTKLLAQYISKRYHWTFASAGYLLSGKAVVNFTLLTIVIPSLLRARHSFGSTPVSSYATSTAQANIRYTHACLAVSVLGAFFIALAAEIWLLIPSLLLYALGSALPVFTLSLLKSPAITSKRSDESESLDSENHIFALVMMVKTLGSLVGAPLMPILWVRGITQGGVAIGTPYFVSSGCYALAIIVISQIYMR